MLQVEANPATKLDRKKVIVNTAVEEEDIKAHLWAQLRHNSMHSITRELTLRRSNIHSITRVTPSSRDSMEDMRISSSSSREMQDRVHQIARLRAEVDRAMLLVCTLLIPKLTST